MDSSLRRILLYRRIQIEFISKLDSIDHDHHNQCLDQQFIFRSIL